MMTDRPAKLFLGGVPGEVSKSDLHLELSKYGAIVDLWVARNPPGFAFVTYENMSDAEKALRALNGSDFFNTKLRVEFARNRSQNEDKQRFEKNNDRRPMYDDRRYRSPSPPHRRRERSPSNLRYPYEHLPAFYPPDMLNTNMPNDFSYPRMPGYFQPPIHDDMIRPSKYSRRDSRSPPPYDYRRRSRSPMRGGGYDRSWDYHRDRGHGRSRMSPVPYESSSRYPSRYPPMTSGRDYGSRSDRYDRSPSPLPPPPMPPHMMHMRMPDRRRHK